MGWVVVGVNEGLYRLFASVPQVAITQWEWTAAGGRRAEDEAAEHRAEQHEEGPHAKLCRRLCPHADMTCVGCDSETALLMEKTFRKEKR